MPTCTSGAVRGLVKVPVSTDAPSTADCTSTATAPVDDVAGFVDRLRHADGDAVERGLLALRGVAGARADAPRSGARRGVRCRREPSCTRPISGCTTTPVVNRRCTRSRPTARRSVRTPSTARRTSTGRTSRSAPARRHDTSYLYVARHRRQRCRRATRSSSTASPSRRTLPTAPGGHSRASRRSRCATPTTRSTPSR